MPTGRAIGAPDRSAFYYATVTLSTTGTVREHIERDRLRRAVVPRYDGTFSRRPGAPQVGVASFA
ncbi:hypothetical protein OHB35_52975 [Streptomyces phaeochromogenes]|uniref:Uncharacterized protein n=1 Tax=Streptomyces phaeochromogenes TaxID=1923 RepID=A0ABZ1HUK1_STRPH|nr:hypothetical protein [Streptomyces phaeochromogenes]WSD21257.1 hypothetical protein OHB35_52975 [Streptomyces phaeochromogenes]